MRALLAGCLLLAGCELIIGDPREPRDLAGADFAGADFAAADFAGLDFAGADFAMPDLAGADLAGADFAMPDLATTSCVVLNSHVVDSMHDTGTLDVADIAPVGSGQFLIVYISGTGVYASLADKDGVVGSPIGQVTCSGICVSPRAATALASDASFFLSMVDGATYYLITTTRALSAQSTGIGGTCGAPANDLVSDVASTSGGTAWIGCGGTANSLLDDAKPNGSMSTVIASASEGRLVVNGTAMLLAFRVKTSGGINIGPITPSTGVLGLAAPFFIPAAGTTLTGIGFDYSFSANETLVAAAATTAGGTSLQWATGPLGFAASSSFTGNVVLASTTRTPIGVASRGGLPGYMLTYTAVGPDPAAMALALDGSGAATKGPPIPIDSLPARWPQVAYDATNDIFGVAYIGHDGGDHVYYAALKCN